MSDVSTPEGGEKKLAVRIRAIGRFVGAVASGLFESGAMNDRLRALIVQELDRRGQGQDTDEVHGREWQMYTNKLLPFRPRLIGALGAYAAISGKSAKEVAAQGGLDMFRMMWFLAAAQDDLIDAHTRSGETDSAALRKDLIKTIFGPDRIFYQPAYTVIANELKASDF
ncbi:MAG: hypothetical protein RIQ56_944, partial [Candidatus Parcubacteria bacterium]